MILELPGLKENDVNSAGKYAVHEFHGPDNHFFPKYQIKGVPSATDEDPYCFAGQDNWEEIATILMNDPSGKEAQQHLVRTPQLSVCLANPDQAPYYEEKFHSVILIKKDMGLETGIVLSPEGQWYITSGVYKNENGLFVLLARKANFVSEADQILRKQLE